MQTFATDIIPKIQRFSQRLDDLTLLMNQHWVAVDELSAEKRVYIFRPNNELLISVNGKVIRAKWEYLGFQSLLLELNEGVFLFKHSFLNKGILAFKLDSKEEYAFFINENFYSEQVNTIIKLVKYLSINYAMDGELPKLKPEISNPVYDPKEVAYWNWVWIVAVIIASLVLMFGLMSL